MSSPRAAVVLAVLLAVPAAAVVDPTTRCQGQKLEAASRKARGMLGCHAHALRDGSPLDAECTARAAGRFATLFAAAEASGACPTAGDGPAIETQVDGFVVAALASAATAPAGCGAPTLQAAGRAFGRLIHAAGGFKRSGNASRLASGQARARAGFALQLARTGCASPSADAVARSVDALADTLVPPLWCGDGVRDPAEVCDGADDRACPGSCRPDCRCAPGVPFACLGGSGPLAVLAGVHTGTVEDHALAPGMRLDARAATFLASPANLYPLNLEGAAGTCLAGGTVAGQYDRGLDWEAMHDPNNAAVRVEADAFTIDGIRIDDVGDGIRPAGRGFAVRAAWLSYVRDDCLENDHLQGGIVEDSLFDGCYVAVSERPSPAILDSGFDGRTQVLTIHGSLLRLEPMPGPAGGNPGARGHGQFFKWHERATQLALHDNVFLAEQVGQGGPDSMAIPDGLVGCANNVMVWLGSGDYPAPLPPCFTVSRDRGVWDAAVAAWHTRHPEVRGP